MRYLLNRLFLGLASITGLLMVSLPVNAEGVFFTDACDSSLACDTMDRSVYDGCAHDLGLRQGFADNGITFDTNITQFYFGTVAGGIDQTARYGGHGDYVGNIDFGKLGLQQGLSLNVRAEHRFGSSIAGPTGAFLPATLATELPTREDRDLHLTSFVFTQMLSDDFLVYAGKVDTLDGDRNQFAHGRGITQFSNLAFVANPVLLRTIPRASLGAGFAYLLDGEPLFSFLLINPTDTSTSSGFDELFDEGVAMSAELRVPTNFWNRPGHWLLGATYSTRDYVSFDRDPRITLPQEPIDRASDSWSVYWNTDHYLHRDRSNPSRGWGYFTRAGVGDDDTNAISYFWSFGIGGNSPLSSRPQDSFGIGYFFSEISSDLKPILANVLGPVGDSQGIEMFYNIQTSQSVTITPDFQWISQAAKDIDDAYLLGVRVNLRL